MLADNNNNDDNNNNNNNNNNSNNNNIKTLFLSKITILQLEIYK